MVDFTPAKIYIQTPPAEHADASKVPALVLETLSHLASVVESIQGAMPAMYGLGARVAKMRAALDAAIFHSQ